MTSHESLDIIMGFNSRSEKTIQVKYRLGLVRFVVVISRAMN